MNTRFPVNIPVFDNNVNMNINLFDGYQVTTRLFSLPHKGSLFFKQDSVFSLIQSIPADGLLVSSSLYYQPIDGEFSEEIYTQFNITVSNIYGSSSLKTINLYVDWVNSALIIPAKSFNMTTHIPFQVDIDVIDIDNDKNYTRFIAVSSACVVLQPTFHYGFSFTVEYLGGSDVCTVEFVCGDSHGLESNHTIYTFTVSNELQPVIETVDIFQGENITLPLIDSVSLVEIVLLNNTHMGTVSLFNLTTISYYSDASYFSFPTQNIHGQSLDNPNPSFCYQFKHKTLLSPIYSFSFKVIQVNSPPVYVSL